MSPRPRRSVLFLPASNPRALAKARTLDCDVVVLDLEDAVAPDMKVEARDAAVAAVGEGGFGHRELVVRINTLESGFGAADCLALRGKGAAVLIPKVDDAGDVARYAGLLEGAPLWAMVESPRAALDPLGLAAARGLAALVAGTNDLAKAMHARPAPDRLPLLGFLAAIVAAARANGLAVIDGVCNAIDDADRLAAECAQGAAFGFDGKSLIHPNQIDAANAAFAPDAAELARARRIVAAFAEPDSAERGAIRLDGDMVERLHLEEAERLLALAAAIGRDLG